MMEKFAEDDKIEQMNEKRRRMKREEHKRAVNLLLEERRQMRHKAKLKEAEAINERKMEEQERSNIIEEERMRILQQNIDKLVGHIPKGILSEADVDALGGKLKTIYSQKSNVDPLLELERKYGISR